MKIKLNFQGMETVFAELSSPEKQAIYLLMSGKDKGNKITKLTAELVSIIAYLFKKLNWIEEVGDLDNDKDRYLISKANEKESNEGITTNRTVSDDSEDEENEINTSIGPEAGNDSAIFEDLIKDDHDKTMTEAEGEDKMKENCFEPGSKSSKSGEEKMEQIDTKKAEKSIVDSPITSEVLFSCSFCQKKFTFKSNLDRHERTKHNNPANEKFRCSYCEKKFSDMIKLSKHESKHRGEKPYTCSTCDQTFAHSHHLRSHERIHTGNLLSCNVKRSSPGQTI